MEPQAGMQESDPSSSNNALFKKRNRARPVARTKIQLDESDKVPDENDDKGKDDGSTEGQGGEDQWVQIDRNLLVRLEKK